MDMLFGVACIKGNMEMAKRLLEMGAKINDFVLYSVCANHNEDNNGEIFIRERCTL